MRRGLCSKRSLLSWMYLQLLRLSSKELAVALLLGLTMAVGVSVVASWRAPDIIPVVSLTMVLIVV
nr:hypothetical protein [Fermentimonas sp.]